MLFSRKFNTYVIPYLCYFFKKVECHHLLLFLKKCLFISGCAGPLLLRVGAEGAVLLLVDARELLIAWLLLLRSFSCRGGSWAHGRQQLWLTGCSCCRCCSVVSDSVRPQRRRPTRLPRPWDSPGKNTGVDCHFLLQESLFKI